MESADYVWTVVYFMSISTNYATARSSILMKKVVRGHTVKDQDYRNVPLGLFSQKPLRKKYISKKTIKVVPGL